MLTVANPPAPPAGLKRSPAVGRCVPALLLAVAGLAGCATGPPLPPPATLWRDDAFAAADALPGPSPQAVAARLFEPSAAMRAYAAEVLRPRLALAPDPRRALVAGLYQDPALRLVYDDSLTRTAAEAFDARAGNCLSLALMTASFARLLGLPVRFQQPEALPQVTEGRSLTVWRHHVNVALASPRRGRVGAGSGHDDELVVDFVPGALLAGLRHTALDERTLVAMFLNNRAAELLDAGALDAAYAWSRAAVGHDPAFVPALNTLAVVYRRAGLADDARRVLERALALAPFDPVLNANRGAPEERAADAGGAPSPLPKPIVR